MIVLCIEVSADPGVIGLYESGRVTLERVIPVRDRFADEMELLLQDGGIRAQDVSSIAIGNGPGSFTGLRVGLAWAKGFALVREVPVWPVSSLKVVATNTSPSMNAGESQEPRGGSEASVCVISPARRDHVHFQIFEAETLRTMCEHQVVATESLGSLLSGDTLLLGPAVARLTAELRQRLASRIPADEALHRAHSEPIAALALSEWRNRAAPDLDSLTPYYGLDFSPTKPADR